MAPGPVEPKILRHVERERWRRVRHHPDGIADCAIDDDPDRAFALEEIAQALADHAHVLVTAGTDDDHIARLRLVDGFLNVEGVAGPGQNRQCGAEHPHGVLERLDLVVHGTVTAHGIDELGGVVLLETLDQFRRGTLEFRDDLPMKRMLFPTRHRRLPRVVATQFDAAR